MRAEALVGSVWYMHPDRMRSIIAMVEAGIRPTSKPTPAESPAGMVQVIPVYGTVTQRADILFDMIGGATTEVISRSFDSAMNNPAVDAVVLDIDSPGGSVYGVDELAAKIREGRAIKPVYAIANSLMASAAYYIGSAASEVWVTPGGEVGSIGTLVVHADYSGQLENEGVKVTIIKAGDRKAEANPYEPLSDKAKANLQGTVDDYYAKFVNAVAVNRGVTVKDAASERFGKGLVFRAEEAAKRGIVDRVGTYDSLIAHVARKIITGKQSRASTYAARKRFDMRAKMLNT